MENIELIDKYLSGQMTETEMVQFEQTLGTDPLLNKEFLFQQDIIEAIKQTRRNELKAKLDAIDVSGLTTASSLLNVKTIATATVIAIGAITAYFLWPVTPEASNTEINTEKTVPQDKEIDEQLYTESVTEDKSNPEVESSSTFVVKEKEVRKEGSPAIIIPKGEKEERVSSDVNDNFGDFDEDFNEATAPDNFMNTKGEFEHSTIDVVVNNNKKKYSFHYQIKDNTLYLFGNFEQTYEVLDFNHGNHSDLFFVYDEKYYNLDESKSGISPLEEMSVEASLELQQKINSGNAAKSQ